MSPPTTAFPSLCQDIPSLCTSLRRAETRASKAEVRIPASTLTLFLRSHRPEETWKGNMGETWGQTETWGQKHGRNMGTEKHGDRETWGQTGRTPIIFSRCGNCVTKSAMTRRVDGVFSVIFLAWLACHASSSPVFLTT